MSARPPEAPATALVGANPRGALRRASLAVRRALALLPAGAPLLVALSGGADSLALALVAIDSGTRAGRAVHTLTVDHALRAESAEEAAAVAGLATRLGAIARVERVEVGRDGGPEGAARDARRAALAERALDLGASVLLGHTLDDQAETVLLRLARGSGASSIRAMAPDFVDAEGARWIRPLLGLRRSDTEAACREAGLEWVEDPSNLPEGPWRAKDGSPLRRGAVRARAIPALADALGADPAPALARTAELAARDDDALERWAAAEWGRLLVAAPTGATGGEGPRGLLVAGLAELPLAVRTRLVRRLALDAGARPGDLSSRHVDAACALVDSWTGQGPLALPGARARRSRDALGRPVLLVEASR